MKKICGCKNSCGCGDNVLSSDVSNVTAPECVDCEKCSESFDGKCLKYTGDYIENVGIEQGMSFNDIVQKLVLLIVNPGCNYPNSPGQSVVGFYTKKINSSSVEFFWNEITGAQYILQYRLSTSSTWTTNPAVTSGYDKIGGLLPNTTYFAKLTSTINNASCTSLTIKFTTKSN